MQRNILKIIYETFTVTIFIPDTPQTKLKSGRKSHTDNPHGTMLSEDYAEIVDEEGDYSTPAGKFTIEAITCKYSLFYKNIIFDSVLLDGRLTKLPCF